MVLRALFDQVCELEGAARAAFLAAQPADVARELEELLARDAASPVTGADTLAPSALNLLAGELERRRAEQLAISGFRLLRLLGQGGMGEVWLAEREVAGHTQRLALKLLRPGLLGTDALRRFHEEQRLLLELNHPGIARLLDAGSEQGLPWIAMEYVDGAPITEWCDRQTLDIAARMQLFVQVCVAVQYAHDNLVVHRDLKPGNVLVANDGSVRLLDFGIAKSLQAEPALQTGTAQAMFSLYGVAPEQMLGRRATVASDVYALGALLYELCSGELALECEGLTPAAIERRVVHDSPPPPSQRELRAQCAQQRGLPGVDALRQLLRGDLDRIVLHALRKDPSERYPSARALAEDIGRWQRDEPVLAVGQNRAYRLRKFLRRHRLAASLAAVFVLALVILSVLLALRSLQLEAQRDAAQQALARAKAVNDFMIEMFRAADPTRSLGERLSAAEVLRAGVRSFEHAQQSPGVAAPVLLSLAMAARGIGDLKTAESLSARADQLFQHDQVSAADQFELELLKLDLAINRGRPEDAETALQAALRYQNPDDSAQQARLQLQQIRILLALKRDDEALSLLESRRRTQREDDPDALQLEALLLLRRQQPQRAAELLDAPLARLRAGPPRIGLVMLLQARATAARNLGDTKLALALSTEAVERAADLVGARHLFTQAQRNTLANALNKSGQPDAALAVYAQIIEALEPELGSDDPLMRMVHFNAVNAASAHLSLAAEARTRARAEAGQLLERLPAGHFMRIPVLLAQLRLALLDAEPQAAWAALEQAETELTAKDQDKTRQHLAAWRISLQTPPAERKVLQHWQQEIQRLQIRDRLLASRFREALD